MKSIVIAAVLSGLAGFGVPAAATTHEQAAAQAKQTATLADGEVRRVDREANKVTIRHGPIATLDMPSMTMVFQVRDAALLQHVKPGDKIRFAADKVDGAYVLTQVEHVQ